MDNHWYARDNVRQRLIIFGRAMQGVSPYHVIIEPDKSRCPSGYCSFTLRRIAVNPTHFAVPPKEQYELTKALLVHEAGHKRFTSPDRLPALISQVANILEDERVERRMCEEFVGARWFMQKLSERFYERAKPIDETSDNPGEVVLHFLQLRWAKRIGQPVKGGLSPKNQVLWQKIAPLVYEAWEAESSELVNHNAKKIAHVLGFWLSPVDPWHSYSTPKKEVKCPN